MKNRELVEAALLIALAAVLYLLSPGQLPYAGRISLEMLPIFFLSFRRGYKIGAIAGGMLGLIILAFDPRVVHPLQFILDYPLPHILVGFSGIFKSNIYLGIIVGSLARFLSHYLSGVIFFAAYSPEGMPVWLYSALYNGIYILPQVILALIIVPVLLRRIGDVLD